MRIAELKRKDGQIDKITCYEQNEFPYHVLNRKVILSKSKKNASGYMTQFATFDIESTTIRPPEYIDWIKHDKKYKLDKKFWPYGFMYHWQMCVAGVVCYGRTWPEWLTFMDKLRDIYETNPEERLVIFVHNLGYEFQFIRNFLERDFGGYEVFAAQPRKPMHVKTNNGFEFRCTYKLSNMSLEKFCENERDCIHPKAAGDLDYKVLRTPSTHIKKREFGYCIADVVGLYESIQSIMKHEKDTLVTMPLTSTGYIRRDVRRECRHDARYREKYFLGTRIDETVYIMLKEAGRGGNTHTNRYMAGDIWKNADSFDEVSGYPAMQLLKPEFPISKFTAYGDIENRAEFEKLNKKYATLFRVVFRNLRVRKEIPMPYLPISKANDYSRKEYEADNGRFLSAGCAAFTLTNVDWEIVKLQYQWDEFFITDMHFATKGYLPEPIRRAIKRHFTSKCELKLKIQKLEEIEDLTKEQEALLENYNYLYAKSKNRLNGIFGMTYSDIVRDTITIDEESGEWKVSRPEDIESELAKYYKSKNSFLNYAWGVWTTALNRYHLETLLQATGGYGIGAGHSGRVIYCDTDSSKCIDVDYQLIDELNQKIIEENIEADAYVDIEGERFYLGLYDKENKEPIKEFKALGAKKYAYVDNKGLHVTISGVNKKLGAEELGDIKNFKPGMKFIKAGGTCLYYNDDQIHYIEVNGEKILTASNVGMVDSSYTLNITDEYAALIGYGVEQEE